MRRVVVTGVGIVSSIGQELNLFWQNLGKMKSGLTEMGKDEMGGFGGTGKKFAGKVEILQNDLEKLTVSNRNKQNGMALIAARNALEDSGIGDGMGTDRVCVVVGSDKSQVSPGLFFAEEVEKESARMVNAEFFKHLSVSGPAFNVCKSVGNQAATFGCGNGFGNVGAGVWNIADDDADVGVVGCSEQSVHPYFIGSGLDKDLVQSDGSAVLILEELQHAKSRKAKIYAEIKHFSQIHEESQIKAHSRLISSTLESTGLQLSALSLIMHNSQLLSANSLGQNSCIHLNPQPFFGSSTGGLSILHLAVSLLIMTHNNYPNALLENSKTLGFSSISAENILCIAHSQNQLSSSILLSKFTE